MATFAAIGGPATNFGPGDPLLAHTPDEHVSRGELDHARGVLATVLLPVSLVLMIMLANDKGLMGPWANKRSTNAIGITVIAFVGLCGAAYGIDSFLLSTHLIG